jgi:hypothetical protein
LVNLEILRRDVSEKRGAHIAAHRSLLNDALMVPNEGFLMDAP